MQAPTASLSVLSYDCVYCQSYAACSLLARVTTISRSDFLGRVYVARPGWVPRHFLAETVVMDLKGKTMNGAVIKFLAARDTTDIVVFFLSYVNQS
jgi:hypothetical protein